MTLTNLSDEARKKGLEKARLVRKKRSEIKEHELFENYIAGMKVLNVISSLPGNGRMHAARVLEELKISPHKKMGGLGKNQKENFYKHFNIT